MGKRRQRKLGCMTRGCNAQHYARGLCEICYHAAKHRITNKKDTSWEQLEAEGRAAPPRLRPSPFTRSIRSAKRKAVS